MFCQHSVSRTLKSHAQCCKLRGMVHAFISGGQLLQSSRLRELLQLPTILEHARLKHAMELGHAKLCLYVSVQNVFMSSYNVNVNTQFLSTVSFLHLCKRLLYFFFVKAAIVFNIYVCACNLSFFRLLKAPQT